MNAHEIVTTAGRALEVQIIEPPRAPSDMTDAEIGAAAAEAVERHLSLRSGSVEAAVRAGELLREARHRCETQGGSWRDWLRRYWPKSRQTAQRYMALALEVQQNCGPRAGHSSALLGLPSVRAAMVEIGYDAGSSRDEPEGMREPGADEDEEAPGPDGLTSSERATVERIKADEANEKAESDAARKQRIEAWKAKKRAEERQGLDAEEAARRAAAAVEEAGKRADRERQLDADRAAIKAAEDRPRGPEAPKPKPTPQAESGPVSVGPDCDAMEALVLGIQRRWSLVSMEDAPMVEKFGRMVLHPRDESRDYVAEWVNAGAEIIRHLQNMKAEDVKVLRALKRAASVGA